MDHLPTDRLEQRRKSSEDIKKSYVICTNPRSGSWLLSEGLAATSLAGNPLEWLDSAHEQNRRALWAMQRPENIGFGNYLGHVLSQGTTSNGVFGIKLHYYQLADLPRILGEHAKDNPQLGANPLSALFPNLSYIWLTRRDKARQAISYYRASKTDEWWSIEGVAPRKRADSCAAPPFDAKAISHLEGILVQNDHQWKQYFDGNDIAPLKIDYEDLAADYAGQILTVLNWLGVLGPEGFSVPPPRLRQQANHESEEWYQRYLEHKADAGHQTAEPEDGADGGAGDVRNDQALPTASPLFQRINSPAKNFPDTWRQWIGESKLLKASDQTITDVLAGNGFDAKVVADEISKATSSPYLKAAERSQRRLRKVLSLLRVFQNLASLDPNSNIVERRSAPTRVEFLERYYIKNRPVILQGLMKDWKALESWNAEYFKAKIGTVPVEIMTGRGARPLPERRTVPFSEYVDMVYSGNVTNDYYLEANNHFFDNTNCRLLFDDMRVFEEYLDPNTIGGRTFFWFGPAGTVTSLHHDLCNIFMAQVSGRKLIRLISACQWNCLYNDTSVFSPVDCENPDLNRWPQFRNAAVLDLVLEPGEVLFLPVGWWHYVRALDVAITVTFTNFVFPNSFDWK